MLPSWLLLVLTTPSLATPGQEPSGETALVVRAKRLIVRPGEELDDGALLIERGRIVRVGTDVETPEGARELTAEVACAGFVDGWSSLSVDPGSAQDGSATASTSSLDGFDPYRFPHMREEALAAGVTSKRIQVGRDAGLAGIGVVVTVDPGAEPEILLEDACVAAVVGASRRGPRDVFDRIEEVERLIDELDKGKSYRENLVEYEGELETWEKAIAEKRAELEDDFKKAKKKRDKEIEEAEEKGKEFKEEKYKEDKKPKPPRYDANTEVMARVANGELPLVVESHRAPELRSLLEETEAFARLRLVVAGASEGGSIADELVERRIPVLLWPTADPGGGSDHDAYTLELAGELAEAGVEVIFGSGGGVDTRELRLLAARAVGHGMDREAALHALTLGPARAFDVANKIGSLERGKRADVLLLDGDPLDTNARIQTVITGGRVVEQ